MRGIFDVERQHVRGLCCLMSSRATSGSGAVAHTIMSGWPLIFRS